MDRHSVIVLGVFGVVLLSLLVIAQGSSGGNPDRPIITGEVPNAAAGYLKIGDIKGESSDKEHKEWIIIDSLQQGIFRDGSLIRDNARFEDIVIKKGVDKSTPKLQEAIAMGSNFPDIEIELVRDYPSSGEQTYYRVELKNVKITSYLLNSAGLDEATISNEQISLNFEEIKIIYAEYDKQGSSKGNVEFEWKVEEGES